MKQANLKLNPKKRLLFQREVEFLGHTVLANGIKHEVRSFLGLCTYFNRFVNGFADFGAPLHRLTDLKSQFNWTAFKRLKNALCSSPILFYLHSSEMFILDTDASNIGIVAVLSQLQDKEEKVIEYFSSVLSEPEKNYCATKKELLAIVRAVEHFHKYLYRREFLIRTDHAALTWLLQMKNCEGQVGRWLERLQQYHFKIRHSAGKLHNNADSLSRRPCKYYKHCDKIEQHETSFNYERTAVIEDEEWTAAQLIKDQEEDVDIGPLLKWKEDGVERPGWSEISYQSPSFKVL